MYYYLADAEVSGYNASNKARGDIVSILGSTNKWQQIDVHRCWDSDQQSVIHKVRSLFFNIDDWRRISSLVKAGDVILVPYPLAMQPKVARTAVPFLRYCRQHGVRIIVLIHDLDSIRWNNQFNNDIAFVSVADAVVVHNGKMRAVVESWTNAPVVELGVFDYLYDGEQPVPIDGIDVAGNLSQEKAGWLYRAIESLPFLPLNLYGAGVTGNVLAFNGYRGAFSPDLLPARMTGKYGLVWDGDSILSCTGNYGEYLRINSPHKLSLYLALGKPVFIWSQAAEAEFVREKGVGVLVDSVSDAIEAYASINQTEYREMRARAWNLSVQLRSGFFTKNAVENALKALMNREDC